MSSDQASPHAVAVYVDSSALVKGALAAAAAGLGFFAGAAFLFHDHIVMAATACLAGTVCAVLAGSRAAAAIKWGAFSGKASSSRAYIGFETSTLHLLGEAAIPWSSIEFLKISRLSWPRRSYFMVGFKPGATTSAAPMLPKLSSDNMLIAHAHRQATGTILEPHTFLALCIEAKWSILAPVALTHDGRSIAGLAGKFYDARPAVVDPAGAAAAFESAQQAYQRGDASQAQALCRQAVAKNAEHDAAHFMLGMISLAAGAEREAEAHLRRALALRQLPAYAGNLGLLLLETKRSNEAESLLRLAHTLAPEDADIMGNLADALKAEGRLDEAEALYLRVIALDPRGTTALNNLGLLYWKQGRLPEAENHLQRALAVSPLLAVAHSNLGIVQKEMGQFKEAEASYRRALELHPQSSQFHNNLGLLFQETCRQDEAQQAFERALEIDPDDTLARFNLSLTRLAFGDFARGLPGFEARYDRRLPAPPATLPDLPFVQWQGEDLAGKSLVILPEQGFGDYLQFARYFPLLKARGLARLTVFCPTALAPLLRTAGGVDAVVSDRAELADHDYWAFPMSLALRCDSRIDTIPSQLPYLHALPERLAHWGVKLATPKRKVGLVWKGALGHKNDVNRSLPSLDLLAPLWDIADVQFFSLQKGQGEAEAQAAASAGRLIHLGSDLNDLADTAAVVAQLDLVICVDTAIAHVAGALGKPCWVLLPAVGCDWRWHLERDDSPWYPGVMRLFHQRAAGNWPAVIAGMAQALQTFQAPGEAPAGQAATSE